MSHAADALIAAIERTAAPVCVGIDPVVERLPEASPDAARSTEHAAAAIGDFTLGVLDAVAGEVPCVKLQSACYERYGPEGLGVLASSIAAARERGLVVILDAKRGDIGISAEHYAEASFGRLGADWLTVNAYLGRDGLEPFLRPERGAFALVRTSNAGGDRVQSAAFADGSTVSDLVADLVADVGSGTIGDRGYSALGAVVGATKPEDVERLRARMPWQVFLLPGFGAQGAGVDDVKAAFDANGLGAVVTASRSVIYAGAGAAWRGAVTDAARRLADEIGRAAGLR